MLNKMRYFPGVLSITLLVVQTVTGHWDFVFKELPSYDGPDLCDESVESLREVFTEYPASTRTGVNFLEMLDPCNHVAEEEFLQQLRSNYTALRKLGATQSTMRASLKYIWEAWRAHTVWGKTEGNRICNPRRLLSCHESLSRCVCRQNFALGDAVKNRHYSHIQTSEVLKVDQWKGQTWVTETVKACQVKANGICDWEIPWFGFCHLPCAGDNMTCVGQPETGSRGPKLCRLCFAPEGIFGDRCIKGSYRTAAISNLYSNTKIVYYVSVLLIMLIFLN